MPKNVIVVGMPRSGTSMTAAIFTRSGYFAAEDESTQLRGKDEYNPGGYWEAEPLINANADIFKRAGYSFDNTWLYDQISDDQVESIFNLEQSQEHIDLVKKYNLNKPWMWKDPRLCYTLGYWWPVMDKKSTCVLLLKRDPHEIYQSFLRLEWRSSSAESRRDVYDRIVRHIDSAEHAIRKFDIPYIEVNYSDYKNDPDTTAKRLSEFFEIEIGSDDLGYDKKLNTSGIRGASMRAINKFGDLLPDRVRKFIKALVPVFILKVLFPNRYSG